MSFNSEKPAGMKSMSGTLPNGVNRAAGKPRWRVSSALRAPVLVTSNAGIHSQPTKWTFRTPVRPNPAP